VNYHNNGAQTAHKINVPPFNINHSEIFRQQPERLDKFDDAGSKLARNSTNLRPKNKTADC